MKKIAKGQRARAARGSRSLPAAATARGRAAEAKRRGAYRRRRKPAKLRFLKKDRVYHLVDATAFVISTDALGFEHRGPAPDALTVCCAKPIAKVWGVAIGREAFNPPVNNWCKGAP